MRTVLRGSALCALLSMLAACGGGGGDSSTSSPLSTSSTSSTGSSTTTTASTSSSTSATGADEIALTASSYTATPASTATFAIYRTGNATGAVSVAYSTVNGTAIAGSDYVATSGSVSWSDGEASVKTIDVPVTSLATGKHFAVALTSIAGPASFGSPTAALVSVAASASGTSPSGPTPSASGTMVPSASQIVDSALNVWTLVGGVVDENGAAAGYSSNVAMLLYFGGTVYQANKTCLWWSWNGSGWVETTNPDPSVTPSCSTIAASASIPTSSPAPAAASTSTVTPSGNFGIQVKGNKFVSAKDGTPLQLVGTNISGLETGMKWRWAAFANAGTFWSKVLNWGGSGLNVVRLPLNEASWLNYTCYDPGSGASGAFYTPAAGGGYTPDPSNAYQAAVKQAVADATAAGLYVILDLHWASPNNAAGQPLCPIGQPAYADAAHALTFWKQIADAFKNNPAVMFELFNEPFGSNVYSNWVVDASTPGSDAITLRDGGAYSPFLEQNNTNGVIQYTTLSWQVAGMQDMVNTIRGEGATNVILSSPIGWAGEIETWLATKPTDPIGQLGVAWHVYGYRKGQSYPLAVLAAGYPIMITETYGLGAIGGYGWAASQSIGYTWWGWNDWGGQALTAELAIPPWVDSVAP
jgi:hypothetical protein